MYRVSNSTFSVGNEQAFRVLGKVHSLYDGRVESISWLKRSKDGRKGGGSDRLHRGQECGSRYSFENFPRLFFLKPHAQGGIL